MFYVNNRYPATIWMCIQWWDPKCPSSAETWRTEGWFRLEPGENTRLNVSELDDMRTIGNSHFYYFITASDGAYWAGPFQTECPNTAFDWCLAKTGPGATSYGFRELIVTTADCTLIPSPASPRDMIGTWVTNTEGIEITMKLTQSGSAVSGNATTNVSPDVMPVSGTCIGNNVHLTDSSGQVQFNGSFTDDNTVTGTFKLGSDSGPSTLKRTG